MSKRFTPLSAAVAAATAGLMVVAAGCAMETRNPDTLAQATSHESADTTNMPSTEVASADTSGMPANGPISAPQEAQSGIATEPGASTLQPSGVSTAYPDSARPQPSSTVDTSTSTTAASPATYPATPESSSGMNPAGVNSASSTSSSDSSTSSTSSTTTSTDPAALPPRTDRN